MTDHANRVPASARAAKPSLLLLVQFVAALAAAGFLLVLALAPFDLASYRIDGEPVSGLTFFREAWPAYLLAVGLHAAIAFGLWGERPWVRRLLLVYWPGFGILLALFYLRHPEAVPDLVGTALFSAVASVVAWWYLYRRENVVTYFRALEQRVRSTTVLHN